MRYEDIFFFPMNIFFWLKNFLHTLKNSIENDTDKKCCVNFIFPLFSPMKLSRFFQNKWMKEGQQSSQTFHEKLKISFDDFLWFFPTASLSKNFSRERYHFPREKKSSQTKGKNLYQFRLVSIQTLIESVEKKGFSVENFKKENLDGRKEMQ